MDERGQAFNSDILGVLLAGGRSRRMGGGDKCLVELAGRPLLAHAIERLRPQVTTLILSANGDPARFAAFGLPVIPDLEPAFKGPLAGILAGMVWARARAPEASFIAVAAADTPFFPRDLVARLRQALEGENGIAIARSAGRDHPVFGLFPITLAADLATFLEVSPRLAVMAWIDRHPWTAVAFEPSGSGRLDPFFNINTSADLDLMQSEIDEKGLY